MVFAIQKANFVDTYYLWFSHRYAASAAARKTFLKISPWGRKYSYFAIRAAISEIQLILTLNDKLALINWLLISP